MTTARWRGLPRRPHQRFAVRGFGGGDSSSSRPPATAASPSRLAKNSRCGSALLQRGRRGALKRLSPNWNRPAYREGVRYLVGLSQSGTWTFRAISSDRGRNWSRPVRVDSDPLHNGADQFFQWLAVDPVDGAANIVFYDRDYTANGRSIVVLARSTDDGQSFTNYA